MASASDKDLQRLHSQVAKQISTQLSQSDEAQLLLDEYAGELPQEVTEFLEKVSTVSPALLTVATRFLKDNAITCEIEESDELSELEKRLQDKKRKRVGNVEYPFE